MATLGEGTEPEPRGSPGVGPWEVLWKYLEVPPLQVQELGAPDVVPCEDVLILTETKMLQPGGNLLRAPKMSCRRRRRERGQGPGPGRRQPAPQNAHMPQQPGPRDASSRRPPPSHRHCPSCSERGRRAARSRKRAAQGLPSVPAGRPSAFKAFRVPGVQSSRPKGDGAGCTAEASSPPPEGSCHFVPRQEGRQSFHVVRATTIEKNPISRQTEEKSKGATLIGSQHPQRAAQHRVLGTPVLRASPLDRDFKPQFDDPKAKRPLVSLSIDFTTHNSWRPRFRGALINEPITLESATPRRKEA